MALLWVAPHSLTHSLLLLIRCAIAEAMRKPFPYSLGLVQVVFLFHSFLVGEARRCAEIVRSKLTRFGPVTMSS